ncbi:UNVERIFIED_CONTAM: Vinorine synthase [Sesamum latifolium]|uniref:Vinorine synthase n=1 Tax=Sesamum latifolium TaxID=2727402 RepID=A0AAW2W332_9LAMI
MHLVYFYESHAKFISNPANSNHLQKSLSQVLSKFYPLAGHLVDDLYVDCNDEGVPYVEAVANCSLSQVIKNPVVKNMDKFLPTRSTKTCKLFAWLFKLLLSSAVGLPLG